jgi:hypothetical protein
MLSSSRSKLSLEGNDTILREVCMNADKSIVSGVYHTHLGNQSETKPDTVCWHCCHPYEGEGIRLPRLYDQVSGIYHVHGWFCSANCAKAYILEHSTFDRGYLINVFMRMLREVYSIHDTVIEAPPRLSLRMFGGALDIDSFRTVKNVHQIHSPPFVSHIMVVEERKPIASIGEEKNVRGLKRPTSAPLLIQDSPTDSGLYSDFLSSKAKETKKVDSNVGLNKYAKKGK